MVKALRELQLSTSITSNGREIGQHIRCVAGKASQKVRRVRKWVFNLNFAKVRVPLLLLGFLLLLHPHREIQLGVTASFLVFFFVFFITTKENQNEENSCLEKSSLNTKNTLETDRDLLLPPVSFPIHLYSFLPLKFISQLWGMLADLELPQPFGYFSVWLFVKATGCKREEAEFDDLSCYKTVSQFFTRKLKPGLRPISGESDLVSPADGTVTYSGVVEGLYLEQVKGVQYSLREFLGRLDKDKEKKQSANVSKPDLLENSDKDDSISLHSNLLLSQPSPTQLYQTVIYLSPSDYHRFHSPASWTVIKRRHFPGKLYSVAPSLVRKIPGLFHINERVAFIGRWDYGFFAMVAVGATNVGSIKVHFDAELNTNTRCKNVKEKIYETPIELAKGEEFGYFNFGSTIVLIYEAPVQTTLDKEHMRRVKMGERMWMDAV